MSITPEQEYSYEDAVDEIAKKYGVPRAVWEKMVRQESGGDDAAVSPKGAKTRWQIMPGTARQLGYKPEELDADPLKAAEAGLRYLRDNYKAVRKYAKNEKHSWMASISAYHAGPGAVLNDFKKGGYGLPLTSDGSITTRDHVLKIFDGLDGVYDRSPLKTVQPGNGTGTVPVPNGVPEAAKVSVGARSKETYASDEETAAYEKIYGKLPEGSRPPEPVAKPIMAQPLELGTTGQPKPLAQPPKAFALKTDDGAEFTEEAPQVAPTLKTQPAATQPLAAGQRRLYNKQTGKPYIATEGEKKTDEHGNITTAFTIVPESPEIGTKPGRKAKARTEVVVADEAKAWSPPPGGKIKLQDGTELSYVGDEAPDGKARFTDADGETYLVDKATGKLEDETLSQVAAKVPIALVPYRDRTTTPVERAKETQAFQVAASLATEYKIDANDAYQWILKRGFRDIATGAPLAEDRYYQSREDEAAKARAGNLTATGEDIYNITRRELREVVNYSLGAKKEREDAVLKLLAQGDEPSAAMLREARVNIADLTDKRRDDYLMALTQGKVASEQLAQVIPRFTAQGFDPYQARIKARQQMGMMRDANGQDMAEAELAAYDRVRQSKLTEYQQASQNLAAMGAMSEGDRTGSQAAPESAALDLSREWTDRYMRQMIGKYGSGQKIEEARQSEQIAEAGRKQRIAAMGGVEWAKDSVESIVSNLTYKGLGHVLAATLQGGAVWTKPIADFIDSTLGTETNYKDITKHPMYQAGRSIDSWLNDVSQSRKDLDQEFIQGTVPKAIASSLAFLFPSLSNKPKLAIALYSTAQMGGSSYEEAIQAGASPEDAQKFALLNSGLFGWTEIVGVSKAFARLNSGVGGTVFKQYFRNFAKHAAPETFEEVFLNEGPQTIGQNILARVTYDPDRKIDKGLAEAIGAAVLSVGTISGGVTALNTVRNQRAIGKQLKLDAANGNPSVRNFGESGLFIHGKPVPITDTIKPLVDYHTELQQHINDNFDAIEQVRQRATKLPPNQRLKLFQTVRRVQADNAELFTKQQQVAAKIVEKSGVPAPDILEQKDAIDAVLEAKDAEVFDYVPGTPGVFEPEVEERPAPITSDDIRASDAEFVAEDVPAAEPSSIPSYAQDDARATLPAEPIPTTSAERYAAMKANGKPKTRISQIDEAATAPAVKEPWQMTHAEYFNWRNENPSIEYNALYHHDVIERALKEGRPVPPEVLAAYPDLAKSAKPAASLTALQKFEERKLGRLGYDELTRASLTPEQRKDILKNRTTRRDFFRKTPKAIEPVSLPKPLYVEFQTKGMGRILKNSHNVSRLRKAGWTFRNVTGKSAVVTGAPEGTPEANIAGGTFESAAFNTDTERRAQRAPSTRRGKPFFQPKEGHVQRLWQAVASSGGIKESRTSIPGKTYNRGELDRVRHVPGVINNKSGRTAEEMAKLMYEAGYLHDIFDSAEHVNGNELLEAIEADHSGEYTYRSAAEDQTAKGSVDDEVERMQRDEVRKGTLEGVLETMGEDDYQRMRGIAEFLSDDEVWPLIEDAEWEGKISPEAREKAAKRGIKYGVDKHEIDWLVKTLEEYVARRNAAQGTAEGLSEAEPERAVDSGQDVQITAAADSLYADEFEQGDAFEPEGEVDASFDPAEFEEPEPAEVVTPEPKPAEAAKPKALSNTQIEFASEDAKLFDEFRRLAIDAEDVAPKDVLPPYAKDGIFEIDPHITVKYGLHTNDAAEVSPLLKGAKPITITLGKTATFAGKDKKLPGTDKPIPYDVVIVEVESPDLAKLNKKLTDGSENTTTFPYKPHVTLAYVKPGLGEKYAGLSEFEGKTFTFDALTFSPADKSGKVDIPLKKTTSAERFEAKKTARAEKPLAPESIRLPGQTRPATLKEAQDFAKAQGLAIYKRGSISYWIEAGKEALANKQTVAQEPKAETKPAATAFDQVDLFGNKVTPKVEQVSMFGDEEAEAEVAKYQSPENRLRERAAAEYIDELTQSENKKVRQAAEAIKKAWSRVDSPTVAEQGVYEDAADALDIFSRAVHTNSPIGDMVRQLWLDKGIQISERSNTLAEAMSGRYTAEVFRRLLSEADVAPYAEPLRAALVPASAYQDIEAGPITYVSPYTLSVLENDQFKGLGGRSVKVDTIRQVLKQQSVTAIERDIVNAVLDSAEFAGKVSIPFDAFREAVQLELLPLRVIESDSYARYGIENTGIDALLHRPDRGEYGDVDAVAQTHIYNSDLEHGVTGHFSGEFTDITNTPGSISGGHWEIHEREQNGRTLYIVTRAGVTPQTEAELEANLGTVTNSREQAEEWIRSIGKAAQVNKGMFGHTRVAYAGDKGIVVELQSDVFQKHKAENLVVDAVVNDALVGKFSGAEAGSLKSKALAVNEAQIPYNTYNRSIFTATERLKEQQKRVEKWQKGLAEYEAILPKLETERVKFINAKTALGDEDNRTLAELVQSTRALSSGINAVGKGLSPETVDLFGETRFSSIDANSLIGNIVTGGGLLDETPQLAHEFLTDKVMSHTLQAKETQELIDSDEYKQFLKDKAAYDKARVALLDALPLKYKQFIAHRKNYTARLLREEVRNMAQKGLKEAWVVTPRTAALVEGFLSADEGGSMPYEIERQAQDGSLSEGDSISFEGDSYLVVDSGYDYIKVIPEEKVKSFTQDLFVSEQVDRNWDDFEYELRSRNDEEMPLDEAQNLVEEAIRWSPGPDLAFMDEAFDLVAEGEGMDSPTVVFSLERIEDEIRDFYQQSIDDKDWIQQDLEDVGYKHVFEADGTWYMAEDEHVHSETFGQPTDYTEDEKSADIEAFDINDYSGTQKTVLEKYVELNDLVKKEYADVKTVTDPRGNEYLGLPIPDDTIEKGVKLFSRISREQAAVSDLGFYSGVEQAILDKMPTTASAEQVRGILKDQKREEMDWLGIDQFLDTAKAFTRDEVLGFVRENQVDVREVVKGEQGTAEDIRPKLLRDSDGDVKLAGQSTPYHIDLAADDYWVTLKGDNALGYTVSEDKAFDLVARNIADTPATKYSQWTLPGGENYRELLLTMPVEKKRLTLEEFAAKVGLSVEDARPAFNAHEQTGGYIDHPKGSYQSPHFSEPNILAHVRFDERRGPIVKKNRVGKHLLDLVATEPTLQSSLPIMERGMEGSGHHTQIQKAIIAALPVDVVDRLRSYKISPQSLFDDDSVSLSLAAMPVNVRLGIMRGIVAATAKTNAAIRAKVLLSLTRGLDAEILPTLKTSDLDPVYIPSALAFGGTGEALGSHGTDSENVGALSGTGSLAGIGAGGGEISSADLAILTDAHRDIIAKSGKTFDDRDGGKTLHIAEIQSDWHSQGREHGYRQQEPVAEDMGDPLRGWREIGPSAVPDAPFKKSYQELAFKRILRYATERGYQRISWDTGATNADRYDLRQAVNGIAFRTEDGVKHVSVDVKQDNMLVDFTVGADGLVTGSALKEWNGKKVDQVLGKEIAKRIDEGESGEIKGEDLRIGGHGMGVFYDQLLPQFVSKYTKKWGGKVETAEILGGLTYEIRQNPGLDDNWQIRNSRGGVADTGFTKAEAEEELKKYPPEPATLAYSLTITDDMRLSVAAGQKLFSRRTAEDERLMTDVLPNAHTSVVLAGIKSQMTGQNLELTPHAMFTTLLIGNEIVYRRYRDRRLKNGDDIEAIDLDFNNEHAGQSAGAFVNDADSLRKLAEMGREMRGDFERMGYADADLAGYDELVKNLDVVADTAEDFGIVYAFDENLPEEEFHVEDLRAGRTDQEALAALRETDLWKNPGSRFTVEYGELSPADKASELAAKLATNQAAAYGWDKRADFAEQKRAFLNTWYDGVLRRNKDFIDANGFDAFKKKYGRISDAAIGTDKQEAGPETQGTRRPARRSRSKGKRDGPDAESGEQLAAAEDEDQPDRSAAETSIRDERDEADALGVTPAAVRVKNRKFAQTLRDNTDLDVADVSFIPGTDIERVREVKNILRESLIAADDSGFTQGDYEQAIETFYNPDIEHRTKTVLGFGLLEHLGSVGDLEMLNQLAPQVINHVGELAQGLQAASIVAKYDFARGVVLATKALQKQGKHLDQKTLDELRGAMNKLAASNREKAMLAKMLSDAEEVIAEQQAEIADINEALQAASQSLGATDAERAEMAAALEESEAENEENRGMIENLKRQLARWKSKVMADGTTAIRISTTHKRLLDEKPKLLAELAEAFPGKSLKAAIAPTSDALKNWFGDSKVVDENGEPLRVFHGTARDFATFSKEKVKPNYTSPQKHLGFFFTDDADMASRYTEQPGYVPTPDALGVAGEHPATPPWHLRRLAKPGANVVPAYLKLENPKYEDISKINEIEDEWRQWQSKEYVEGLKAEGYDGIIFEGETLAYGNAREFVAFEPTQIKSAIGNRGTFDPNEPSILRAAITSSEDFSDDKRTALVKYTALQIFEGESYEDTINMIKDLTDGVLNDDEIAAIHADAEAMTHKEPAERSDMAVGKQKARRDHQKAAKAFRKGAGLFEDEEAAAERVTAATGAEKFNKLEREMLRLAESDDQLATAAIFYTRVKSAKDWYAAIADAYPELDTNAQNDLFVRARKHRDQARENLKAELAIAREQITDAKKEFAEFQRQELIQRAVMRKHKATLDALYRRLSKTPTQRAVDLTLDILGTPKSMMSTGEVSYVGRQGFLPMLLFTGVDISKDGVKIADGAIKGLYGTIKGFQSDANRVIYEEKLREHRHFDRSVYSGTIFSQIGDFNLVDEHFAGRAFEKAANSGIPVLKQIGKAQLKFEHAYTLPGDAQRLFVSSILFDLIDDQNLSEFDRRKADKFASKIANMFTGKSNLQFFRRDNPITKLINFLGFSPSFVGARFESAFYLSPLGIASAPKGMRMLLMRKAARFHSAMFGLAMAALMFLDADGDDDERSRWDIIDPASKSFLKGRIRGTDQKFDLTANMSEPMRLFFYDAVGSGFYAATGQWNKLGDIWKQERERYIYNDSGEILRYFRGKLSPTASFALDVATGKDYLGRPITSKGDVALAALERLYPLTYKQTLDSLTMDPATEFMRRGHVENKAQQWENLKNGDLTPGNAAIVLFSSALGANFQDFAEVEKSRAEDKAWDMYSGIESKKVTPEQKSINSGLRKIYRYREELIRRGQSTTLLNKRLAQLTSKYSIDEAAQAKLKEQATGSRFAFVTKRMDVAQVKTLLDEYATGRERPELQSILEAKLAAESKKVAKAETAPKDLATRLNSADVADAAKIYNENSSTFTSVQRFEARRKLLQKVLNSHNKGTLTPEGYDAAKSVLGDEIKFQKPTNVRRERVVRGLDSLKGVESK